MTHEKVFNLDGVYEEADEKWKIDEPEVTRRIQGGRLTEQPRIRVEIMLGKKMEFI